MTSEDRPEPRLERIGPYVFAEAVNLPRDRRVPSRMSWYRWTPFALPLVAVAADAMTKTWKAEWTLGTIGMMASLVAAIGLIIGYFVAQEFLFRWSLRRYRHLAGVHLISTEPHDPGERSAMMDMDRADDRVTLVAIDREEGGSGPYLELTQSAMEDWRKVVEDPRAVHRTVVPGLSLRFRVPPDRRDAWANAWERATGDEPVFSTPFRPSLSGDPESEWNAARRRERGLWRISFFSTIALFVYGLATKNGVVTSFASLPMMAHFSVSLFEQPTTADPNRLARFRAKLTSNDHRVGGDVGRALGTTASKPS